MNSNSPYELSRSNAAVSNIKQSSSFKRPITQSKIEIKSVSKSNNQIETKLNVRFEDNQKLPTHTSNDKTPKISLLSQRFTSLQPKKNQKTNVLNLLNWPLDDESTKQEPIRNELASTLRDYYARYRNDIFLEDIYSSKQSHLRSVNPIQSALIELIGKKINENKRHSTSAALCEKNMKATSFVKKDLVGNTNKISDSFSISKLHNTTIAFSIPKQISLNKKSKPLKQQQQQPTTSSIVHNQHDLNLFNGDQLSELAVGITDHEVKQISDMFDTNGFNFNFDLIPNDFSLEQIETAPLPPQPPQLPPPPPPPQTPPTPRINLDKTREDKIIIESERIDKTLVSFTTLLLNCLIRISLFDVTEISYLQKQYDKFVAIDSHIANQQKELNSKKNKIIRFLNNFLSDYSNLVPDLSSEQLRINFIYIAILDLVKKQSSLGYLTDLVDYMEYMEKYNKHFNQLVTNQDSHDLMFSFSTEIKLFLYDLMQELSLKQIEINPITKDSITSLVTPIRIVILHQSEQRLNDPRSQVTSSKADTVLKPIDQTIFTSLFNDIPFAKEYPFVENYYRRNKYKAKNFENDLSIEDNRDVSLIAPPTPRFKIDSFSSNNSSLLVPNIDTNITPKQINQIPVNLETPKLNEQEPVTRRAELDSSVELSIHANYSITSTFDNSIENKVLQSPKTPFTMPITILSKFSNNSRSSSTDKGSPSLSIESPNSFKSPEMNFETTTLGSLNPFKNSLKRKSHDSNSSEDDYSSNRKHRRRSNDRSDTKRGGERSRNSKRRNRSSSRNNSKRRSRSRSRLDTSSNNRRASTNDQNVNNKINRTDQNGVSPIFFNKPIFSPVQSRTCSTPNETSKTQSLVRRDSADSLEDYVIT